MSSFSIHQFSSGIRNPQQNREGKWVSGGYDKEIAKESYNVPPEIKKAVNTSSKGGWRGFGIPDASPPKTGDYALIARELENYCVLAVANKQQDDHNREFIAYRYFWLDKQEFQNERDFSDFDGIATLLYHWQKEGRLQYNIREWANSPELYTNSWDKLKKYEKKTRFFQQNSTRIKPFISNINSDNQSLHYNEPLIYEANEIGVSLRPEEVHCLAIQYSYVKKCSINWAWNVRRLENMQDLPVIYCADAKALNLFGQELIKRRPILDKSAGKMVKGSGGYPTDRDPKTKEIQILIREFRLGQFTEEDVLTLMNYYQEYKQNIVQFEDKFTINYFSTQLPKPSVQNIKYVTLLTALDPTKNKNILSQLMKKLNNKLKNEVAIKFLDDLLRIVTQNPHCFDSEVCGLFCKKFTYTRWKILNLRVIYLAKTKTLNWLNQDLIKYMPRLNKSSGEAAKDLSKHSDDKPKEKIQDFLQKFCGQFTEEDLLKLMNYYQKYGQDIVDSESENVINNLRDEASKNKAKNIKYATLLAALAPREKQDILDELVNLNNHPKNKVDINKVAINFLDELLMTATLSSKCLKHPICELFCKNFTYTKFKLIGCLDDNHSTSSSMRIVFLLIPFFVLSGVASAWIYWRPNIPITIPTIFPSKQGSLAELLDKYDSQYKELEKLEQNQEKNPERKDVLSEELYRGKEKILQKLTDTKTEQYIRQLENREPEQVKDAREKEIYTNLKQFTPEIITGKLPVLNLGIQNNEVNVTTLQKALERNENYTIGQKYDELGIFDKPTKEAVENLQRRYIETLEKDSKTTDMKKDGIVGANTWNLLVGRLNDLQVEKVYETLKNHLNPENKTDENIVSEIEKCRDSNQNEKALMFVNCLEKLNQPSSLAELLNKYDSQYKEFKKLEENQEENEKFKNVLYEYNEKIINKLTDLQAEEYIQQLENREPEQVKDAREKEIYTNLTQFTPEIITEKLPVLNLGIQNNEVNVTTLQKALERNKNYTTGQKYDELGIFDRPTKAAVENLQHRYIETLKKQSKRTDMKKDGIVGANTWNLLVGRLNDLQVEKVYETLKNHLNPENKTDKNIVSEIKKCRDSNQNEKALMFVNCLEQLNQPSSLAELLNKYDSQYKEFKKQEENQEENEKLKNVLSEDQQKIINKLTDIQAEEYIQQLKESDSNQVVDAIKKEIYTNLKQFTPEIKEEKLPVLESGTQDKANVTILQKALKRSGDYTPGKENYEPGKFDEFTKQAVENLQNRNIKNLLKQSKETNMKPDGVVRPDTWTLLVGRLNDLQVEKVYETLNKHLKLENQKDDNIVSEIKKCRDNNQNEKALEFVNCLEKLND